MIYPEPENDPVGFVPGDVVVVVGLVELPDFGKYLMPEDGQFEDEPLIVVATKFFDVKGPLE